MASGRASLQFPPAAPSLWAATAIAPPDLQSLKGDVQADVVIVGGGYTGLSAAHHLAESGLDPVVLEANEIGWGASGRNGGVISAKFRVSFPDIATAHGKAVARRMYGLANESIDAVAQLVDRYQLTAARFTQSGQVKAAHNQETLKHAIDEAEWLRTELGEGTLSVLSAAEVREETGSSTFVGGVRNVGTGGIHPLNYVRGLAAGVSGRGVRIFVRSPALRFRRDGGGVVVETASGSVRARQLVVATNSYSDLTAATTRFQRTHIPFRSAMIATEPLSANLAATIMPTRRTYTETKRMMRWFRMVDDRVIFGGRGAFGKQDSASAFEALRKAMIGIFPPLADVPIAYRWSGLVAMTLDSVPHVGRLDDGTLFAMGYNGAGVAMSTLMGRYIAAFARGETPDVGLLDARRLRPVPLYSLREPAVRLVAGWYQFLDAIGR
ncbi:Glycine/D-amino acid oxidase [Enhydrobacter aerosaccus]|uniref:Glycine/D-amino acid oxidase n=1 Tax=Enhydrobacter aerosaccus TaxID=225324 RepID=A0A1T4QU55_9HYPH|nr:FAD-binding oxidoreductase [Enhydrobacter aerosaccus]SKA07176.1 Glycine/D-amino acid oxidase [Enhydrobacter aerosaccus]